MDDAFVKNIINTLKSWTKEAGDDTPVDPACLTAFSTLVVRGIYDHDHKGLDRLRSGMTPVAARLREWISETPKARRQAMEVSVLSGMLRGALFIMENDDPEHAAKLIKNGETILEILTGLDDAEITLGVIQEHWPDKKNAPSASTISRALGALEEAGFVQRFGATKGRKIRLLPKAGHWRDVIARNREKRMKASPVSTLAGAGVENAGVKDNGAKIIHFSTITPREVPDDADFHTKVGGGKL